MNCLIISCLLFTYSAVPVFGQTELRLSGDYILFPSTSNSIEVDEIAKGTLDVIMLSDSSTESTEYRVVVQKAPVDFNSYDAKIFKNGEQHANVTMEMPDFSEYKKFLLIWHTEDAFHIALAARVDDTGDLNQLIRWTDASSNTPPVITYLGISTLKPAYHPSPHELNTLVNLAAAFDKNSIMELSPLLTDLSPTPAPLLWTVKSGPNVPYNCEEFDSCTESSADDDITPSTSTTNKNSHQRNRNTVALEVMGIPTKKRITDSVDSSEEDLEIPTKMPTPKSGMDVTSKTKKVESTTPEWKEVTESTVDDISTPPTEGTTKTSTRNEKRSKKPFPGSRRGYKQPGSENGRHRYTQSNSDINEEVSSTEQPGEDMQETTEGNPPGRSLSEKSDSEKSKQTLRNKQQRDEHLGVPRRRITVTESTQIV